MCAKLVAEDIDVLRQLGSTVGVDTDNYETWAEAFEAIRVEVLKTKKAFRKRRHRSSGEDRERMLDDLNNWCEEMGLDCTSYDSWTEMVAAMRAEVDAFRGRHPVTIDDLTGVSQAMESQRAAISNRIGMVEDRLAKLEAHKLRTWKPMIESHIAEMRKQLDTLWEEPIECPAPPTSKDEWKELKSAVNELGRMYRVMIDDLQKKQKGT